MRLRPLLSSLLLSASLAVTLTACAGGDGPSDAGTDADADGYTADVDCDDNDTRVNPGAEELCDGLDNDCDGEIDPGLLLDAWADRDGDGFGDAAAFIAVCTLDATLADNDLDCDDAEAGAFPGAPEVCDGIDNNCDAAVDEGLLLNLWPDADADGFGDSAGEAISACALEPGWADNNLDCDDLYDLSYPDAEELCDGEDNDCDGGIDDGLLAVWYVDADLDGYGDEASALETCAPLEGSVLVGGDCDDADLLTNPAGTEVCGGGDEDCSGLADDIDGDGDGQAPLGCAGGLDCNDADVAIFSGAIETWYDGVDQDCGADNDFDADADGFRSDDFGGPDCDDTSALALPGGVEVCGDGFDNDCDGEAGACALSGDYLAVDADLTLVGEATQDNAAQGDPGFAGVGDVNGDGIDDIAISAMRNDSAGLDAGAVYLLFGGTGHAGTESLAAADVKLTGELAGDFAGRSLSGGADIDGDGYGDLLLSAQNEATGGINAGAAYLISGPILASGGIGLADLGTAKIFGAAADDLAADVAMAGDINGDGIPDLAVAAQFADLGGFTNNGVTAVFFGPVTGLQSVNDAQALIIGHASSVESGSAIAGGGDLDGDGFADLVIGARASSRGGANGGEVNVVYGPLAGLTDLSAAHATFVASGGGDDLGGGASVTIAGDMDGDGYAEIAFGARNNDIAGTNAGAVYIVRGPPTAGLRSAATADAILLGELARDLTGDSVAGAGDVDGDGRDELLVGSGYNDAGAVDGGAVYLLSGWVGGTRNLSAAAAARFLPNGSNDRVRTKGAGDFNDDGYNDVLMGVQLNDLGGDAAGAGYLFFGEGL